MIRSVTGTAIWRRVGYGLQQPIRPSAGRVPGHDYVPVEGRLMAVQLMNVRESDGPAA